MNDELAGYISAIVLSELRQATEEFGPMNSAHEGYAVILEELDELWEEIKAKKPDSERMEKEAISKTKKPARKLAAKSRW